MSRILKRPMFRRGGEVGGGIMTGIRQNFAEAGSATDKLLETYAAYPVQSVDPVAKFLISGGLRGLSQTGGGGTLGNLARAFEPATERLFEDIGAQDKARRDLAMIGTKMDIEQDFAMKQAIAKAKGETGFLKMEPAPRAKSNLKKERLKTKADSPYYAKGAEYDYMDPVINYEVDVQRDLSLNPNFKQIAQNHYGLLPYDEKEKRFDYDYTKLNEGANYYDPLKKMFISYTKSPDGKKIIYKGIQYPTLQPFELFTFELDAEGNPIQQ